MMFRLVASQRFRSPCLVQKTSVQRLFGTAVGAQSTQLSKWSEEFYNATSSLRSDVPFEESANRLRELTQTNLLHGTDLRDEPERFFEAHRILARHAVEHGPGFWIRFTVHYNLFAGTVLAVGSDEQVAALKDFQTAGQLGCFSLTEKLAGVQSGLVVQTTVEWDADKQKFILNTPSVGARKNWISQGFTADKTVVLADLTVDGERKGPHAFVMDLRKDGELVDGITVEDMGVKTVGNDLDNAWIQFDSVELPKSAMLSKYAHLDEAGKYVLKNKDVRPFDMIGQRLYTGRIAVAQAALEYRRTVFQRTKAYSDSKQCWAPGTSAYPVLSSIPQLSALYEEAEAELDGLTQFVASCEAALAQCLRDDTPPSSQLVDAIATCKIRAVDSSIAMCFRLKQEVGSYALMDNAGFKHMDFLQCCKFAEGDSRILMQKLSRDRLKQFSKQSPEEQQAGGEEEELCRVVVQGMAKAAKAGANKQQAWEAEWRNVYTLAEAVMKRVQATGV